MRLSTHLKSDEFNIAEILIWAHLTIDNTKLKGMRFLLDFILYYY